MAEVGVGPNGFGAGVGWPNGDPELGRAPLGVIPEFVVVLLGRLKPLEDGGKDGNALLGAEVFSPVGNADWGSSSVTKRLSSPLAAAFAAFGSS